MICHICFDVIYDEEEKIKLEEIGWWIHAQCLLEDEPNT